jgi:transcription elongation factor
MDNSDRLFREGDKVEVVSGVYQGSSGIVETVDSGMTKAGHYEIVWVRLDTGDVEGFKPQALSKIELPQK